jgi:phage-related protein
MRSSLQDLKLFPADARGELGHTLHLVQRGERPENEKPLLRDLSGVSELISDSEDGNTFRCVFTLKLDPFVYVLHCFEKKSKGGVATSKRELEVIRRRLKEAREEYVAFKRSKDAKSTQEYRGERKYRLTDFSIERLMRFLVALGQEVDISIRPAPRPASKLPIPSVPGDGLPILNSASSRPGSIAPARPLRPTSARRRTPREMTSLWAPGTALALRR